VGRANARDENVDVVVVARCPGQAQGDEHDLVVPARDQLRDDLGSRGRAVAEECGVDRDLRAQCLYLTPKLMVDLGDLGVRTSGRKKYEGRCWHAGDPTFPNVFCGGPIAVREKTSRVRLVTRDRASGVVFGRAMTTAKQNIGIKDQQMASMLSAGRDAISRYGRDVALRERFLGQS
jgi:hypothetical protein